MATGFKFSELNADGSPKNPRAGYQPITQVAELSAVDIDFEEDEPHGAPPPEKKTSPLVSPLAAKPVATPVAAADSDILANTLPSRPTENRDENFSKRAPKINPVENFSASAAPANGESSSDSARKKYSIPRDDTATDSTKTATAATVRQVNRRPLFESTPETDSDDSAAATVALNADVAPMTKSWWQKIGDFVGGLRRRKNSTTSEMPLDLDQSTQLNLKSDLEALNQPSPAASAWRSRLFGWVKNLFPRGDSAKPMKKSASSKAIAPGYAEYPTLKISNNDATLTNSDYEKLDLPPQPASEKDWFIPEEALAAAENDILSSLTERVDYSDTAVHAVEIFSKLDAGKKTASFANSSLREKVNYALNKIKNMSGSLLAKKKSR